MLAPGTGTAEVNASRPSANAGVNPIQGASHCELERLHFLTAKPKLEVVIKGNKGIVSKTERT